MANNITIYGLVSEIEPNNIRYVGITRRNPKHRLNNHLYEAKHFPNKSEKTIWFNNEELKIKQIL